MHVTGLQIREALRRWNLRREVLRRQFEESLWAFDEDEKQNPETLMTDFKQADMNVALLECEQQRFNLHKTITVQDVTMTMGLAIKLIGGAGRMEKMWRNAITNADPDRYSRTIPREKDKDKVYAKRQITQKRTAELAEKAATYATALRSAIAFGNTQSVETDLPSSLFE